MKRCLCLITTSILTSTPLIIPAVASTPEIAISQQIEPDLESVRSISVKIDSNNNGGSGVIIGKQKDKYLVITNHHVIRGGNNLTIQTTDGTIHQAEIVINPITSNDDVALLTFSSNNQYQVAQLNSAATGKEEQAIIAVGYSAETGELLINRGTINGIPNQPLKEGYQIGYSSDIVQGMSGGAILNIFGDVIGINGISAFPIYEYEDGTKPTAAEIEQLRQLNWGIPFHNLFTQLKPEIITAYNLPLPETTVVVENSQLTGWLGELEATAKQITVRIEGNNNGSGVIVAKEGNTYTVLTAGHVVCERDDDKDKCLDTDYEIITPDGQSHEIIPDTIVPVKGIDVAAFQFTSNSNYEVAKLAGYAPLANNINADNTAATNNFAFVAGYHQLDGTESPKWQFSLGYALNKKRGSFDIYDPYSFDEGYRLVYTCITYEGMSGGPILDIEGQVIGIHGKKEGVKKVDDKSIIVSLGYSLGIPISVLSDVSSLNRARFKNEETWELPPILAFSWLSITNQNPSSLPKPLTLKQQQDFENMVLRIKISQNNVAPYQLIARGNQLWRLLRYQDAVKEFDRAIELNPKSVYLAWYGKGLALTEQDEQLEAVEAFEQAIQKQPKFYPALRRLAFTYRKLQRFKDALKIINDAIDIEPDEAPLHNDKGGLLVELGLFSEALAAYNKAIKLHYQPIFHLNRSVVYGKLQEWNKALDDLNFVLKRNPDYAKAYYSRANIYYKMNQWKKALADYEEAIALKPNYAEAYLNRGILLYRKRQEPEKALADYDKAIAHKPDYAEAYLNRGFVYGCQEQWQQALADYNTVINLNNNPEAYTGRGLVRYKLGNKWGAIVDLQHAHKLFTERNDIEGSKKTSNFLKQFQGIEVFIKSDNILPLIN